MPSYRFGPFIVDGIRYRVRRHGTDVALTPKLLDLLLHLLEHAGELVTKEQLLDALWPGANVTENALAQAVSELRQAIGDDAAAPQFIKTVARRGYRFIAPVERIHADSVSGADAPALTTLHDTSAKSDPGPDTGAAHAAATADRPIREHAIAVMDFVNVTGDPESSWLSAGIAETVTSDLRALGRFRVIDRWRVVEASRRTAGSLQQLAVDLRAALVVVGSFQRNGDSIRITGRIVDVEKGEAIADAKVDGRVAGIFDLQDQVAQQFSRELGAGVSSSGRRAAVRETSSLDAYRAATEGWLLLETLDVRDVPRAIGQFRRAIAADPRYALAYTGLANAEIVAYETTRSDNVPARDLLDAAIEHARNATALDERLAEAHATLAFVLVRDWKTDEAVRCARRAVALDPDNWRHLFRLGDASWGEERLRAAAQTLACYPDFAFTHFQMAMVHVARGDLAQAETVLRQGAAVQDRQIGRGERYPALGLHWLLALVRLAENDVEEALGELARERELAQPHRLYGREYAMSVHQAEGACLLRQRKHRDAIAAFERALDLYPHHGPSTVGLALALRAIGSREAAEHARSRAGAAADVMDHTRPFEAAMVRSLAHVADGDAATAADTLMTALDAAPRGYALWTIPVEPLFWQVVETQPFKAVLARLAERAR